MWQHDIRHLPVVDKDALAGLVSDRVLLESVGMLTSDERALIAPDEPAEEVLVADVMDLEVTCVTPDLLATDAASQMLYRKQSGLPVMEGAVLHSIVTESDLLRLFTEVYWLDRSTLHNERVGDFGSRVLKTVAPTDTLAEVCRWLRQGKVRHVLVADGDRLDGIVSDWDLRSVIGCGRLGEWLELPVRTAMATGLPRLRSDNTLADEGHLSRIITISDLLRAFMAGATIHT